MVTSSVAAISRKPPHCAAAAAGLQPLVPIAIGRGRADTSRMPGSIRYEIKNMIETLEQARDRLRDFPTRRKWWRAVARRSAVALSLRAGADGLEVLMIERAHREGDRWSGH